MNLASKLLALGVLSVCLYSVLASDAQAGNPRRGYYPQPHCPNHVPGFGWGQGFGNPYGPGSPFGPGFGSPFGPGFGNPYGPGFGNPIDPGFGIPVRPQGCHPNGCGPYGCPR